MYVGYPEGIGHITHMSKTGVVSLFKQFVKDVDLKMRWEECRLNGRVPDRNYITTKIALFPTL